jgi:hypothetical protein
MGFVPSVHGTISAEPRGNTLSARPLHDVHGGTLRAPERIPAGTLIGASASQTGSISGEPADSAIAELNGLISSLGTLSAAAQNLPLAAPTLPSLPQQNYQRQPTDYTQFSDDSNS